MNGCIKTQTHMIKNMINSLHHLVLSTLSEIFILFIKQQTVRYVSDLIKPPRNIVVIKQGEQIHTRSHVKKGVMCVQIYICPIGLQVFCIAAPPSGQITDVFKYYVNISQHSKFCGLPFRFYMILWKRIQGTSERTVHIQSLIKIFLIKLDVLTTESLSKTSVFSQITKNWPETLWKKTNKLVFRCFWIGVFDNWCFWAEFHKPIANCDLLVVV